MKLYFIMTKVNKLCVKVLKFIKKHNMKISQEEFKEICGKDTDAVLAELRIKKIGTYVRGYKSIWSISQNCLESALSSYKSMEKNKNSSFWQWIINLIISVFSLVVAIYAENEEVWD